MKTRLLLVACLVLALGLIAAGCGDDDDDGGGGGSGGGGIEAGTGERKQVAQQAGKVAAEEAGGPVELPPNKTIGFLQILGGIESADRTANAARTALKQVGYKMVLCDGQGDPTKWVTCADSLIGRGVDAILTTGIEPSSIKRQLNKAKAQNIPFVQGGGLVSEGYDGSYYPDEPGAGKILAEDLLKRLDEVQEEPVQLAIHDYPAPWATVRTDELEKLIKGDERYEVVATTQTDPANLVNGTRKTVTDQVTANPDIKAFWFSFDTTGQVGGQAVQAKFPGKKFPDKPLVATFHADLGTLELMRAGAVDVVIDVPYDASQWIAVDNLLEYFARDAPFDKSPQPEYAEVGDLFDYEIVDETNLPPEGEYREPKVDFVTFFETKWKEEFGGSGN
jgi:ABC-type sugar transport system substrate-binding protein